VIERADTAAVKSSAAPGTTMRQIVSHLCCIFWCACPTSGLPRSPGRERPCAAIAMQGPAHRGAEDWHFRCVGSFNNNSVNAWARQRFPIQTALLSMEDQNRLSPWSVAPRRPQLCLSHGDCGIRCGGVIGRIALRSGWARGQENGTSITRTGVPKASLTIVVCSASR